MKKMKVIDWLAGIGVLMLILALKVGGLVDNLSPNMGPLSTIDAVLNNLIPSIDIGMDGIMDQIAVAIYEIAKGLVDDSIPFGSMYLHGMLGSIVGYIELTTLIGCGFLIFASLIALLMHAVDTAVDTLCNLFLGATICTRALVNRCLSKSRQE